VHQAATEPVPKDVILPARGWSEEDWSASEDRLRARGWLDGQGRATAGGRRAKEGIEATTDELAAGGLSVEELRRLTTGCKEIAGALDADGFMRFPNPWVYRRLKRGSLGVVCSSSTLILQRWFHPAAGVPGAGR
jgi:hypothetical protein